MLEDQTKEKVEVLCNAGQIENICKSNCHKSKGQNKAMAMIKYSIDNPDAPQYWLDQCLQFDDWFLILGFCFQIHGLGWYYWYTYLEIFNSI